MRVVTEAPIGRCTFVRERIGYIEILPFTAEERSSSRWSKPGFGELQSMEDATLPSLAFRQKMNEKELFLVLPFASMAVVPVSRLAVEA